MAAIKLATRRGPLAAWNARIVPFSNKGNPPAATALTISKRACTGLFLLPVPLPRERQSIDTLKTSGNPVPAQPLANADRYSPVQQGRSRMSNPKENPGQQTQNPGHRNPGQKPGQQQQGGGQKPGQQQQDPGQGR